MLFKRSTMQFRRFDAAATAVIQRVKTQSYYAAESRSRKQAKESKAERAKQARRWAEEIGSRLRLAEQV